LSVAVTDERAIVVGIKLSKIIKGVQPSDVARRKGGVEAESLCDFRWRWGDL
jgi:hypothetical protein